MDKSLCSKATSADEVPTPGYMYNEIARITHASADACKQLEDFLIKRLKKDNVHQKLKVLRVIKHCCAQGHATFRRDMQRQTGEVKSCLGERHACAASLPAPLCAALWPAAPAQPLRARPPPAVSHPARLGSPRTRRAAPPPRLPLRRRTPPLKRS